MLGEVVKIVENKSDWIYFTNPSRLVDGKPGVDIFQTGVKGCELQPGDSVDLFPSDPVIKNKLKGNACTSCVYNPNASESQGGCKVVFSYKL